MPNAGETRSLNEKNGCGFTKRFNRKVYFFAIVCVVSSSFSSSNSVFIVIVVKKVAKMCYVYLFALVLKRHVSLSPAHAVFSEVLFVFNGENWNS